MVVKLAASRLLILYAARVLDLPVERYFRDARFMMTGGGISEIMRYIIQREVYKDMGRPS
jgi:alkylation response protein AidB-like acyl-CoA dehydrogenase